MKYKGKFLTQVVDSLADEYGSIMAIPNSRLRPIQDDFKHSKEVTQHRYFDECECPWNRTLKTHRRKIYQIAKILRMPDKEQRKAAVGNLEINANTAYNVVYQLHLHHRGYSYKCRNHNLVIVSYRHELLDAIKSENLPGPRSETELSKIIKNGGWYAPTGTKVGIIRKLTILRGIDYYPYGDLGPDSEVHKLPIKRQYV